MPRAAGLCDRACRRSQQWVGMVTRRMSHEGKPARALLQLMKLCRLQLTCAISAAGMLRHDSSVMACVAPCVSSGNSCRRASKLAVALASRQAASPAAAEGVGGCRLARAVTAAAVPPPLAVVASSGLRSTQEALPCRRRNQAHMDVQPAFGGRSPPSGGGTCGLALLPGAAVASAQSHVCAAGPESGGRVVGQ